LPHVVNMEHVQAFFFGRKHKLVGQHLDQALELKEKPDGWPFSSCGWGGPNPHVRAACS
jgi:hypothetical protein